jgi:DNA-binding NarL/FixJ family response regulator
MRAGVAMGRQDQSTAVAILSEQRRAGHRHGWREVHGRALDGLVRLHLEAGDHDEAKRMARELVQLAADSGMPRLRWSADLAWAAASGERMPALRALALAQAEGLRFIEARAHHVLALVGEDEREHLTRAFELYEQMGAQLWQKQVAARARESGVTLSRVVRSPELRLAGLTETEVQLVELVRDGLNNLEIAQTLHYSRKTVEAYLSRLYRKTGCHSRVGLVVAVERGAVLVPRRSSA